MKNNGDPLKSLFLDVGPVHAASDLEDAVLARLAASPSTAPAVVPARREKALIPVWGWMAAGALLVASALVPHPEQVMWSLPRLEMSTASYWTLAAMSCATLLFALDSVLRSRVQARTH